MHENISSNEYTTENQFQMLSAQIYNLKLKWE